LSSWATIVICQIQLYRWSQQGRLVRPSFRMWGAPYTGYLTLAFLFVVLVLMGFNRPIGTWTVASLIVVVPALIGGWFLVRTRVLEIARDRIGDTGEFPVLANLPPPLDRG
ncbi:MAG: amino acid permease, partial [Mycobacterium sp.]